MAFVPSAYNKIQQPSIQFNNPVSESSIDAIGAALNGLLDILNPVGSVLHSMLTEAQLQAQLGISTTWILADGRNVAGSLYQSVTGNASIPDLRSLFLRGANNGRVDGFTNPDNPALGASAQDKLVSHIHAIQDPGHIHQVDAFNQGGSTFSTSPGHNVLRNPLNVATNNPIQVDSHLTGITTTDATGGNQTQPKNITVNIFIRIN